MDVINIVIDLGELTLGDVEVLSDSSGRTTMTQKLETLSRVCPGTDVRQVKVKDMPELLAKIEKELAVATNPTSGQAKALST